MSATKEQVRLAGQAGDQPAAQALAPSREQTRAHHPHATCVEIPVEVHGSRMSLMAQKRTGPLQPLQPPFHETTHTIIVFPQGAVVRLSATVEPGETVVIMNQKTAQYVLGRVVNVRSGGDNVKGYAEVEFTQRATGFWGIQFPDDAWKPPAEQPDLSVRSAPVAQQPTDSASARAAGLLALEELLDEASAAVPMTGKESPSAAPLPSTDSHEPMAVPRPVSSLEFHRPAWSWRAALVLTLWALVLVSIVAGVVLVRRQREAMLQTRTPATEGSAAMTNGPSAPPDGGRPLQATTGLTTPLPQAVPIAEPQSRNAGAAAAGPVVPVEPSAPPTRRKEQAASSRPARVPEQNQATVASVAPPTKEPVPASRVTQTPGQIKKEADNPPPGLPVPIGKLVARAPTLQGTVALGNEPPPVVTAELPGESSSPAGGIAGLISNGSSPSALVAGPKNPASPAAHHLKQPHLVSSVRPVYPAQAKQSGIQGDVIIEAVIDPSGKVSGMKVVSGPLLLHQAAMDALRQWKYEPAVLDDKPEPIRIVVTVHFRLH